MNETRLPVAAILSLLLLATTGCMDDGSGDFQEASIQDADLAVGLTSDSFDAGEAVADTGNQTAANDSGQAAQDASTETDANQDQPSSTNNEIRQSVADSNGETEGADQGSELSESTKRALAKREAFFAAQLQKMSRQDAARLARDRGFQVLPEDAPGEKREIKLLVPEATFSKEGNALRVSFDDVDLLRVLNMDPVVPDAPKHMPAWLKALDGKRIRLRGFMYPTFQDEGLRGFVLARDNQICCFGKNPREYDLVTVAMRDGVTTDYIPNRPFDVVGVLHITDVVKPGEMYVIDDAIVVQK